MINKHLQKFLLPIISLLFINNIKSQIYIDKYLTDSINYTVIGNTHWIDSPTDLDFKPGTNELWITNKGTEATGGSTVIFSNAGLSNKSDQYKKDKNSRHFMSMVSAISFGKDGTFATSADVLDANHSGGTFTGPTLWTSHSKIYSIIGNNKMPYNGSHLSMLHGSPYSMGIEFDTNMVYWVFDGYHKEIVKYDFGKDHGPGYHDHSNGKIHRYTEVNVTREANIPSHMVLDQTSGWLYICETSKSRILRMNTRTGNKKSDLPILNEPLAEHFEMENVVWEVYIDSGLVKPCGIDFSQNRLLVSDYSNGEIIMYNTSDSTPVEMGRIETGMPGIMGIKIGTDGKIWFVDNTNYEVMRINHSPVETDAAILRISSVEENVCSTISPVATILNNGTDTLTSVTINYSVNGTINTVSWNGSLAYGDTFSITLPPIHITAGKHTLFVSTSDPNNNTDMNIMNDKKEACFISYPKILNLPFYEDFENNVFPPEDWAYQNPNHWDVLMNNSLYPDYGWVRELNAGGFGKSSSSVKMENFADSNTPIKGQEDALILPSVDLSNAVFPVNMEFSVAYAQRDISTYDKLEIYVSVDCGNSWNREFSKGGSLLATSASQETSFTPDSNEWRYESMDLSSYIGQENVRIKFLSKSGYGNNLFLDDIFINDFNTGIVPLSKQNFVYQIFPNPNKGHFIIELDETSDPVFLKDKKASIKVLNWSGQNIYTEKWENITRKEICLTDSPPGIYFVQIHIDEKVFNKKFILQ